MKAQEPWLTVGWVAKEKCFEARRGREEEARAGGEEAEVWSVEFSTEEGDCEGEPIVEGTG